MATTRSEVGVTSTPAEHAPQRDWGTSFIPVIAVVVLLGAGAALSLRGEWTPVLDIAALEVRTQAMPDYWPLVGVFSRFGWYHPGPLFILQGWLPYRLWGPAGMTVAVVTVHLVAIVLAWWVARRIDRRASVFILLAAVVTLAARHPSQALEPWNPYAGLVSAITLIVVAWASAQRLPVGPLVMLPLGSYLLQSHLGYAPLVGLVVVVAAVMALLPGRDRNRAVPWPAWVIAAAAAACLWIPVVVQQITGTPGNISAIVTTFGDSGEPLGPTAGAAVISSAFALRPYWTEGLSVNLPDSISAPWWLLLVLVACIWALARRDWLATRAMVVCLAGVVAGFAAVTTASGVPAEYLVSWVPALASTTIALSAWTITRGLPNLQSPWSAARLSAALAIASMVLAGVTAWHWAGASQQYAGHGQATAVLSRALLADAEETPFNLGAQTGQSQLSAMDVRAVFYGLLAAATRQNADVGAPEPIVWEVAGVVPPDSEPRTTYVVRNVDPTRNDGARVVARWDPLSPAEAEQLRVIDAALGATTDVEQTEALTAQRAELLRGRVAVELVVAPGDIVNQS